MRESNVILTIQFEQSRFQMAVINHPGMMEVSLSMMEVSIRFSRVCTLKQRKKKKLDMTATIPKKFFVSVIPQARDKVK